MSSGVPAPDPPRLPGRWLLLGALVLTAVAGGAFALGSRIASPAQLVAEASPPQPSVITAAVTARELADEVRFRADVALAGAAEVMIGPVVGAAVSTVTAVHVEEGDVVQPAGPLVSVNGVPRLACPGQFAFYRDITIGVSGPDVAQLQACLVAAGRLDPAGVDGIFGPVTQAAAVQAFDLAGFDLRSTIDPAARDAVEAAREQVQSAVDGLADARAAVDDAARAGEVPPELTRQVSRAERALRRAREDLAGAQAEVGVRISLGMLVAVENLPRSVAAVRLSVR